MIKKILGTCWRVLGVVFEGLFYGFGVLIAIIFGSWLLMTVARSATLGFGIAVAGIAVGAGIGCGIYFALRNRNSG
jgi:hypothetical protein